MKKLCTLLIYTKTPSDNDDLYYYASPCPFLSILFYSESHIFSTKFCRKIQSFSLPSSIDFPFSLKYNKPVPKGMVRPAKGNGDYEQRRKDYGKKRQYG